MITVYPEEKGLFTFYFEEQANSQEKQSSTTLQPNISGNKNVKKKKNKPHTKKQKSLNFKTQPSEISAITQQETSVRDIFLRKIIYNKQRIYGRELSPIDEKKTNIPMVKSRRVNATQIIKENSFLQNHHKYEEEFTFQGNCRNLRHHFYSKAKTQGRQEIQEPLIGVDLKLPLIKSTKLTKAFQNLVEEGEMKKVQTKPPLSKSSKQKKSQKRLLKGAMKKEKSLEPIIKQGQHLAIVELSCVEHNNNEWPERKKKLLKKLGRKI